MEGQSIVFASFAINSIIYIFAYRSMRQPIYRMNKLTANKPLIWAVVAGLITIFIAFLIPGLRDLLGIMPLSLQEWLLVFGVAFTLLFFVEIAKAISLESICEWVPKIKARNPRFKYGFSYIIADSHGATATGTATEPIRFHPSIRSIVSSSLLPVTDAGVPLTIVPSSITSGLARIGP